MKVALYSLCFMLAGLAACSSPESSKSKAGKEKRSSETPSKVETKDEATELISKMEGEWVDAPFFDKVEKSREVYANRKLVKGLFGFSITAKGNELQLKGVYVHEGSLNERFNYVSTKTGDQFRAGKRTLEFKNEQLVFTEKGQAVSFKKVPSFRTELSRLIVGQGPYNYLDEGGRSHTVVFHRDGIHCEFLGFRSYEIVTDFVEGVEFDAIVFYKTAKPGNWADGKMYSFDWKNGWLWLTAVFPNWDTYEHEFSDEPTALKPV